MLCAIARKLKIPFKGIWRFWGVKLFYDWFVLREGLGFLRRENDRYDGFCRQLKPEFGVKISRSIGINFFIIVKL